MVTQDPMDPDIPDVLDVGPLDPRDIPPVEPLVFSVDKAEAAACATPIVIVVGGALLVASCMVLQPSMGSTRSGRVEWQRRQLEIEEVVDGEGSEQSIDEAGSHAP